MENKKLRIIVDTSEKPFFYQGYVLDDKDGFFLFKDDKAGTLQINKTKIISIQEVSSLKRDFLIR